LTSRAQPALHVTLHPLKVTGSSFRTGERVTVIANVPPRVLTERAVASGDGSFVVHFPSVKGVPRGLRVRAMGSEGNVALYAPRASRTHRLRTSQE
jgi:hypothetical protein